MIARAWVVMALVVSLQGCFIGSLVGEARKSSRVRVTNIKATDDNWTRLDAAAKELGWRSVRSTAAADFDLRVMPPSPGGELQMDTDPQTKTIDYLCDKGPLKDNDRCFDAANTLVGRAFNVQLQKK